MNAHDGIAGAIVIQVMIATIQSDLIRECIRDISRPFWFPSATPRGARLVVVRMRARQFSHSVVFLSRATSFVVGNSCREYPCQEFCRGLVTLA